MNFAPLAYLDPFELVASLPRRMGLFKDGMTPIRGPRAGADDPDDDTAYRQLLDVNKWPELKSAIAKIKRGDGRGGVEFGRIFLQLLPANAARPWSPPETGAYAERFNRLVVALRTNPGCVHHSGAEALHLAHGVVTWINQRTWTSAINVGETAAILLVVDTRRKDDG